MQSKLTTLGKNNKDLLLPTSQPYLYLKNTCTQKVTPTQNTRGVSLIGISFRQFILVGLPCECSIFLRTPFNVMLSSMCSSFSLASLSRRSSLSSFRYSKSLSRGSFPSSPDLCFSFVLSVRNASRTCLLRVRISRR